MTPHVVPAPRRSSVRASSHRGSYRRSVLGAAAVVAVLVTAACSSGSKSASGPSSTVATSGAQTSGSASSAPTSSVGSATPLKIMVEGAISGPVYALPELVTGAQAAVNRVNANGGVNGHPLQLISCDDQGNPNNDADCGRKAVSDGIIAAAGGLSVYDNQFIPPLEAANIAYIGSSDIENKDHTSPVSFPINASVTDYHGTAAQLGRRGCKTAAVFAPNQPGVEDGLAAIKDGFLKAGGQAVKNFEFSATVNDFTSLVASADSAHVDCFALTTGPQQTAEVLIAIKKSGKLLPVDENITAVVPALDKPVGFPAGLFTANGTYYLPGSGASGNTNAILEQFVSDMAATHATGPAAEVDALAENAYNSVLIFRDVAKTLTDITAPSVLKAMQSFKADTGLTAPIDFSGTGPFVGFPQDKATDEITYSWTGSALVISGDPIQVG